MSASRTLPSLLRATLAEMELPYKDAGARNGHLPSLQAWANLLRALDRRGTPSRELPAILRLSKRAARSRVLSATRRGWVEETEYARGGMRVRLTLAGSRISDQWPSVRATAEKRWRTVVGGGRARNLRSALEELVGKFPLEHPHYPASYGAADASVTGGNGQDWKPVTRKNGDTVSDLPISALVSQALVAFAMRYEEMSPVALLWSAAVIRRIPREGRRLQDLAFPVGVSALRRHGFVRVKRDRGNDVAYLTLEGRAVARAYDERLCDVEAEWRNAFGEDAVTTLREALEMVTNPSAAVSL